ncbi:DNA-3-methyladenine glycosylase I [Thioclava sp. BHET1]|nr:DNA-3-methyladenine glycosylase I [Thioclava sp. BHET1]
MAKIFTGPDGQARCFWCAGWEPYLAYHDTEWGYPVADEIRLFEKLSLEGFQAGLSWRTILAKRENFRAGFDGFDFNIVAGYGPQDVARLLGDAGIVRHRGKIEAVINNAARAQAAVAREGSLARWIWSFAPEVPEHPPGEIPAKTPASERLSKALRKDGWKFVGPTTVYAFMQAMGMVNDHMPGCAHHARAEAARARFMAP